jgi:hypothetical protein
MLLAAELDFFTIDTITLLEPEVLAIVSIHVNINIDAKIGINAKINTNLEINRNPKISTDIDMKTNTNEKTNYFPHTPREISFNTTPIWIKV